MTFAISGGSVTTWQIMPDGALLWKATTHAQPKRVAYFSTQRTENVDVVTVGILAELLLGIPLSENALSLIDEPDPAKPWWQTIEE